MAVISTSGIKPEKRVFHNEPVNVFPKSLPLEKIHFWPENNRTLFSFEILQRKTGEALVDLSIEEITTFISEQPIHKLSALSKSIGRNGVQVPLIIRDDGKLLDGNRRYFACQWLKINSLKQNQKLPSVLSKIPVIIIREKDITHEVELKILAEANFITDLKVAWPLDAQARAVEDFSKTIKRERKLSSDDAMNEVVSIFGITKSRVNDLLDTLKLTRDFIKTGKGKEEKIQLRGIIEERFVYFWEFRNKAMKGRSKYTDLKELEKVKDMFFNLMATGKNSPFKNVKQVEPFVQSKRDKTAWSMLSKSNGEKLSIVVSMMNEKKEVRKAEDKIRLFHAWLDDTDDLSRTTKNYLLKLKKLVEKKYSGESS